MRICLTKFAVSAEAYSIQTGVVSRRCLKQPNVVRCVCQRATLLLVDLFNSFLLTRQSLKIGPEFYQYRSVCKFFWHPHVSTTFWLSSDAQRAAFTSSIQLTTICHKKYLNSQTEIKIPEQALSQLHKNWARKARFAKGVHWWKPESDRSVYRAGYQRISASLVGNPLFKSIRNTGDLAGTKNYGKERTMLAIGRGSCHRSQFYIFSYQYGRERNHSEDFA